MLRLYTSLVLVGIVAGIVLVGTSQAGAAPRRQLQPFTIDLVSVASDGSPGNDDSTSPSLSADGRVVAFASIATNLAPGDTNGEMDIFVHDRHTGQTERVSVAGNGNESNGPSSAPHLSAGGRFTRLSSVAWTTW